MYRIFILSLLAIVFSTFALEPSQVILRATEIRGDSLVLEWSPIEGAKTYKVLYDEESLLNLNAPEPILVSASTDKTHIEIQKMMVGTEYYLVVQGFDASGAKAGETIPLHASTLRTPIFALKNAEATDDQHISLQFSQPIDIKNTTLEILNTETKKPRAIKEMTLSNDDLRVVNIILEGKLEPGASHDIVLKKITNTSGSEMSPESKKIFSFAFSEPKDSDNDVPTTTIEDIPSTEGVKEPEIVVAPSTSATAEAEAQTDISPEASLDALQEKTEELGINTVPAYLPIEESEKTPVEIDKLPQTGSPLFIILCIAIALGATLSRKKKFSLYE